MEGQTRFNIAAALYRPESVASSIFFKNILRCMFMHVVSTN
ncbi:hypothetical protein EDWATA_03285 [Edwardsiella tarda ATCC 23685]|uniref:Uncharacterized protein n=1 Tax=Edwardsiella tarda ATCC 23685 TaxID=500638 RepID=D4F930_EDWTA|nr:hypothetical protein EDWATA_03285 [Edwardsiella tarda ATCC 23685]